MKRTILHSHLVFVLAAAVSCAPLLPPPAEPDETTCADAAARLTELGCNPPDDFVALCERARASHAETGDVVNTDCLYAADSCAAARACKPK